MAIVSSHILDSVVGDHAQGIRVSCYRLSGSNEKEQVFDVNASEEGRIAETVTVADSAEYELIFHSAEYFKGLDVPEHEHKQIMPVVAVRITLSDEQARYHIPLVLSPHSYTLWWSGV